MSDPNNPKIAALQPLVQRVRTDVTAVKRADGSRWTRQPLTPERLAAHCNGGPARGVCPIREGESVTLVGTVDLDDHAGAAGWSRISAIGGALVEALQAAGGFPLAFRSSGGHGVHVHCVWDAPQDAASVRAWLRAALARVGLVDGSGRGGAAAGFAEVFPKQDRVPPGGYGNQWILPLAGASCWLELDEMSGTLVEATRELDAADWQGSADVPIVEREPIGNGGNGGDGSDLQEFASMGGSGVVAPWRQALDALSNAGSRTLAYDDWRNVIFAIHAESGGSPAGLELAHAWSSRSTKYDGGFLEGRVWPYVRAAGERGGPAVTGGTIMSLAARLEGWSMPLTGDGFEAIEDPDAGDGVWGAGGAGGRGVPPAALAYVVDDSEDMSGLGARQANLVAARDAVESRELAEISGEAGAAGTAAGSDWSAAVPPAAHLCTDQANAHRLLRAHGEHLLVAAGSWYVWDGRRWARQESGLYRFACGLSALVRVEAERMRKRVEKALGRGDDAPEAEPAAKARLKLLRGLVDALEKWSAKCESKATIEACVGLLKKMLVVDVDSLNAHPWLLNVRNGTVDLRTGELRPHDPADRLTLCASTAYVPGGRSAAWEKLVWDVCCGDAALVKFLRLWFGYCCTGSTREQKFVVHWGLGGNGKSTVLEAVAGVLGDYAATAAPGLLTGKGASVHSSGIVALCGKRMVTAHENDENVTLREGFVKSATGSDRIPARYLFAEQFEFVPTHKLQLLTNHKPGIRGQDRGIWRRVRLVPYVASFGSAEAVARGEAQTVEDGSLLDVLRDEGERVGLLADLVRAAGEWWREGLPEPDVVRLAGEEYRSEQDRLGQFLRECCELGRGLWVPLVAPMGGGLYPAYQSWCREAGVLPASKQKFTRELPRLVPGFRTEEGRAGHEDRRRVTKIHGLWLLDAD